MLSGAASLSLDSVSLPGSPSLESDASATTAAGASGAVVSGLAADCVLETRGPAPCDPAERACRIQEDQFTAAHAKDNIGATTHTFR